MREINGARTRTLHQNRHAPRREGSGEFTCELSRYRVHAAPLDDQTSDDTEPGIRSVPGSRAESHAEKRLRPLTRSSGARALERAVR